MQRSTIVWGIVLVVLSLVAGYGYGRSEGLSEGLRLATVQPAAAEYKLVTLMWSEYGGDATTSKLSKLLDEGWQIEAAYPARLGSIINSQDYQLKRVKAP